MFDDKLMPVRTKDVLLGSARVEAEEEDQRRKGYSSPGHRQRAGAMAERVRSPAPEYQSDIGAGGELIPTSRLCENSRAVEFYDTVAAPDYVTVDASRDRLELANAAGALESGLDLADTIGAQNSAEKMLAHQMAAVHRTSMTMLAQVNRRVEHMDRIIPDRLTLDDLQRLNVETCRLAGTVTRMMNSYQQGLLTLQKLRTGGQQQVVVQHQYVTKVEDGGQAVVAGEVKTGGGGHKPRGGKSKNER